MRDLPLFLMQVGPLSANVLPVPESVRRELMVSVIIFRQSLLRAMSFDPVLYEDFMVGFLELAKLHADVRPLSPSAGLSLHRAIEFARGRKFP